MSNLDDDLKKDKASSKGRLLKRLATISAANKAAASSEEEESVDDYTASSDNNSEEGTVDKHNVINTQKVAQPMKRNRTLVRRTTSSNRQKGNKRPTLRRKIFLTICLKWIIMTVLY